MPGEAAAQRLLPLVQGHPGAAFRQSGGRRETGDPAAHHGDRGRVAGREAVPAGGGQQDLGLAVAAAPDGAGAHRVSSAAVPEPLRATNVCVMPVCHPGRGRARASVNPARVSRPVKTGAVSKARTLRHRWW